MSRLHELDGFQVLSGVLGVVAGPVMLALGAPAGWAFLIIAAGAAVLLAQWAIVSEVSFDPPTGSTLLLGAVGVACLAVAVIYLTRAANDLPALFPGYDHDSENYRLIPGIGVLLIGVVSVGCAVASVHPTARPQH